MAKGRLKKKSTKPAKAKSANGNGANLGFEEKLWTAADKLRGNMDASEYKHVVLGLIFLKYISDAFTEKFDRLGADKLADPEDRDEYLAANVFWVPPEARWPYLLKNAKRPGIGKLVDDAMAAIERDNPRLKGVLPRDYARPSLDKTRLGELVDLLASLQFGFGQGAFGEMPFGAGSQDVLGRVYEYFLGRFASAEGKGGGEFYTPQSVVKLLVEMIEPYKGRVFDPCCGSGGMFVQSEKFILAHGGRRGDIAVYGQESNFTTWKLCQMNLAIRGIDAEIRWNGEGSFHKDAHADLKADFVLANPPFNDSDWGGQRLREDARWRFGPPPASNANYAWISHFIHHLAPNGVAGFVMANGSMSSNQSGEGDIRRAIVNADLVDCMIAMPGQLFYTTQIPVCLWFLTRNKGGKRFRDRRGQTLFIDARKMGRLIDRTHRELDDPEIARIAGTYHAWRGKPVAPSPSTGEGRGEGGYADVAGFCKSATLAEIETHGFVLTPGRYVGAAEIEDDGEPFEEKMPRLIATLEQQFAESAKLAKAIRANLTGLGLTGEDQP